MADELDPAKTGPLEPPQSAPAKAAEAPPPAPEAPKKPGPDVLSGVGSIGRGALEAHERNRSIDAALMQMQPPPPPQLPAPPKDADERPMRAWAALAIAFGALAGRMTQTPLAASLNAAGQALNAFQEGKHEVAKENFEKWRAESERMIQLANYQQNAYKEVLGKYTTMHEFNVEEGKLKDSAVEAKLKALSVAMQDPQMAKVLQEQGLGGASDLYAKREKDKENLARYRIDMSKQGQATFAVAEGIAAKEQELRRPLRYNEKLDVINEVMTKFSPKGGSKAVGDLVDTPEKQKLYADQVLNYKVPYPTGWLAKQPGMGEVAKMVNEHPEYDQHIYGAITNDIKDLETGKSGTNLTAMRTAAHHLAFFEALTNALPNNSDVGYANRASLALAKQFNIPGVTNFETARRVVTDEVLKTIIGSSPGALADREKMEAAFNNALSKEGMQGAISTVKSLVAGRVESLYDQHVLLKQHAPQLHAQFFSEDAMRFFDPKWEKRDAFSSTTDYGSKARPRKGLQPDEILGLKEGTWVQDPSGEAIEVTPEFKSWLQQQASP